MKSILFICLGNICRSPTAEGVTRALAQKMGISLEIDSAGTGSWHVGEPPCDRATRHAARRGYALGGAARQVRTEDFTRFDLILAMDRQNLADLRALAPASARDRVQLFRDYDPEVGGPADVPDPYYGGEDGFELVLDIVERAAAGLLERVR